MGCPIALLSWLIGTLYGRNRRQRCQSARNFDPPYCLTSGCYPAGADRTVADRLAACAAGGAVGGAECPSHAAPSTAPGKRAPDVGAVNASSAINLSAAFFRSARSSRCTIECCFLQN